MTNRLAVPGGHRVADLNAPPQFIRVHVEVVQLDADPKAASYSSHSITLYARPQTEIEHDAETQFQDLLRQAPEFSFDLLSGGSVPGSGAKGPEPFVLRETHSPSLRGEPRRESGLARPGQTAGENESSRAHGV